MHFWKFLKQFKEESKNLTLNKNSKNILEILEINLSEVKPTNPTFY